MSVRLARCAALAAADLCLVGQSSGFLPGPALAMSLAASVRRSGARPLPPLAALLDSLPLADLRAAWDAADCLRRAAPSAVASWRSGLVVDALCRRGAFGL